MTKKEIQKVKDTTESEGFDYAFSDYSEFKEIKDKEFHRLREAFLTARQELMDYCGIEV